MKYMKIITLWISMVYFGVSFVNAQSPGMACCGDVEYDPNASWGGQYAMTLDFTQIVNAANNALNALPIDSGCRFGSPTVTGSIKGQFKEDCCEDILVELKKFEGTLNVDTGVTCNIPVPFATIPLVADTTMILGISLAGEIGSSVEETCEEDNVCFNVNLGVSGGLGGSVEILEGIVRAQAIIGISGGFEGEICSNDEQFNGVSVCFGSLSGTVKTSAVWGIWENSYNYVWDDFNTCEK